jgi:hypothetical protein
MPLLLVIEDPQEMEYDATEPFSYPHKVSGNMIEVPAKPARTVWECLCWSEEEGIQFPIELPALIDSKKLSQIKKGSKINVVSRGWSTLTGIQVSADAIKKVYPSDTLTVKPKTN